MIKTIALSALVAALTAVAFGWFVLTDRVEGQYFESAGVPLHYTDEGAGDAVILLHGFAVNADLNWRRSGILGELAEKYRVVAVDLRGHGLSGKPHLEEAYGTEMFEDVVRLMDHLEIETAHLVGYSLGGVAVLALAARHPARLRSASLLAMGWEAPDDAVFRAAIPELQRALEGGRSIGPLSEHLGGPREQPSVLHSLTFRLMTGYFNDPNALAALVGSLPEIAVSEAELGRIRAPVLAVVGEHGPFRPGAEALCDRLADYRLVVVDGADHVRVALSSETLSSLLRFLSAPEEVVDECLVRGGRR